MYRVLFVDDEPIVKVALRDIIPWDELGFEISGSAANGEEALRQIELSVPHLVITDLKMPKMDGIELIRKTKKHGFSCIFLVISNYGEYELVREALKLGAMDYLLKISMNEENLLEQVEKVKEELDKRQGQSENEKKAELMNISLKKLVLRDFMNHPEMELQYLMGHFSETFHELQSECFLFYAVILERERTKKRIVSTESIESILQEALETAPDFEVFSTDSKSVVAVIPSMFAPGMTEKEKLAGKLARHFATYITSEVVLFYTESGCDYAELRRKFYLCKSVEKICFYEHEKVINAETVRFNHFPEGFEYRTAADNILEKCFREGAEEALIELEKYLQKLEIGRIYPREAKRAVQNAMNYVLLQKGRLTDLQQEQLEKIIDQINDCTAMADLKEKLRGAVQLGTSVVTVKKEIRDAIDYMTENYKNKISLCDIAEYVHLNESYLCRTFSEQTGKNITNFLNDIRMEKAIQYIINGDYQMKEIAEKVGIENQFYFSKLFKAKYKVSPSKYLRGNKN